MAAVAAVAVVVAASGRVGGGAGASPERRRSVTGCRVPVISAQTRAFCQLVLNQEIDHPFAAVRARVPWRSVAKGPSPGVTIDEGLHKRTLRLFGALRSHAAEAVEFSVSHSSEECSPFV